MAYSLPRDCILSLQFILIFKIPGFLGESTFSFSLQENVCNTFENYPTVYFPLKFCTNYRFETISIYPNLNMTCIRVSEVMYPWNKFNKPSNIHLDLWITTRSNILQEFYKPATNRKQKLLQVLNRHLMIIKILIMKLNVSVSACDQSVFSSERDHDINFGLIYQNQLEILNYSLIYSRETFKIQFVSPKSAKEDDFLVKIINPIGLTILYATLLSAVTISLVLSVISSCHYDAYGIKKFKILNLKLIGYFIALMYRAIVDQCTSKKCLNNFRFESRLVYACWLYYSLLVIATYKSGTIHQLMKPPGSKWITTFKELAEDPSNMTLLGIGDRSGQTANALTALIVEYNRSDSKDKTVFKKILDKYYRPRRIPGKEIIQGRVCILDDAFIMQMIPESFEKFYGGSMFGLSKDSVENMEFWSVKKSQIFSQPVLNVLHFLADCGILDFHRNQQEITDRTIGSHLLRDFVFQNEFLFDEEENENIMTYWSDQLQKGPISLKLRHIYVLVLLLGVGLSLSILSLIFESCIYKLSVDKPRISHSYLKSTDKIFHIAPALLINQ